LAVRQWFLPEQVAEHSKWVNSVVGAAEVVELAYVVMEVVLSWVEVCSTVPENHPYVVTVVVVGSARDSWVNHPVSPHR
jgi:hypothetical protein